MERKTKIILIVSGALLLAGSIGALIYLNSRKRKKEEQEQNELNPYVRASGGSSGGGSSNTNTSSPEIEEEPSTPSDNYSVHPTYNVENELSNSLSQLKGRMLYPKRKFAGGWDYANVRRSAEVNTNQGFWSDGVDNLITTINAGTPIGKVLSETTGLYNGYSYRWFKVKLYKPVDGWFSDYTEGFVRADTVTIKPY